MSPTWGGHTCVRSPMAWPITRDPVYGCWRWTGSKSHQGYGTVWRHRRPQLAHQHVYESEVGPVPAGMELDHVCRRRDCVNPAHLEPVRRRENERRKIWAYRAGADGTCRNGHASYEYSRRTPEGGRICRLCSGV